MPCCGQNRARISIPIASTNSHAAHPEPAIRRPVVLFEYTGRTAMAVIGAVSGLRYSFGNPGAQIAIDPRDATSLSAVPNLRRI